MNLSHFNDEGRARMVDISGKADSIRTAVARTTVSMQPTTLQAIHQREIAKGDVLAVAQVAGIMAAKRTAEMIPMCHPIQLKAVDLHFSHDGQSSLNIEATVRTTGATGVEMEALTAVSVAALTVYDMCKSIDQAMHIGPTQLQLKTGGKNGDFIREN